MRPIAGLVLAGGRSTRMGQDKAALLLDGETLARRQARCLAEAGIEDVFLSLAPDQPLPDPGLHLPVVRDATSDLGPLAGILAGLERVAPRALLVLAVDMPGVDAAFLRRLTRPAEAEAAERDVTGGPAPWSVGQPPGGLQGDTPHGIVPRGIAPKVGGRWEPLCALYPPEALAETRRRLRLQEPGARSPSALLDALHREGRLRALPLDPETAKVLRSWNAPEDLPVARDGSARRDR